MSKEEIKNLLNRYNAGLADDKEVALLETWYIRQGGELPPRLLHEDIEKDLLEIYGRLPGPQKVIKLWPRIAAAASLLIFLSAGLYFYLNRVGSNDFSVRVSKHDIAAGGNKAVLTLSDGKKIVLTGAKNGRLADQGLATVQKTADGDVLYAASKSGIEHPNAGILYNTIETPRGGQYHLTLADGTQVWLNAASSLKYPTVFKGNQRQVELTGEAYFEVVHNAKQPFEVVSGDEIVRDLGTHFNINAYTDEPSLKTTLLEGSISVTDTKGQVTLEPGQQSVIAAINNSIIVRSADIEEVIAWKNGRFRFNDEKLGDIMRQVARWYDVNVIFEDERLKDKIFAGVTTRFSKVSQLLHILELTGEVKFRIENKKIFVMDK